MASRASLVRRRGATMKRATMSGDPGSGSDSGSGTGFGSGTGLMGVGSLDLGVRVAGFRGDGAEAGFVRGGSDAAPP